jgi:hypothetical protein
MAGWVRALRVGILVVLAALLLGTTAGCGGSPDEPTLPVVVSADGRHFVGSNARPWFGVGDTAWSLMVQIRLAEAEQYLDDRAEKGFNLVLANLLESSFASDPPANADGELPFVDEPFASPPNPAYWEHVDAVVAAARQRGIVLLLCPAYLGFEGDDEGWADDMVAATNNDLRRYGQFLAARYRGFDNIMWLLGHDRVPDREEKQRLEALAAQLPAAQLVGLSAAAAAGPLGSPPWQPTTIEPDFETVYSYADDPLDTGAAWLQEPTRPVVYLEGRYEQERDAGEGDPQLRRQLYGPLLAGASAVVFGNNPIWNFEANPLWPYEGTWQTNLDSLGSQHTARFAALVDSESWWRLTPDLDDEVVVDGVGEGSERASVRRGEDRALVYVPTARTMTLDLTGLRGDWVQLERVDPTTGEVVDRQVQLSTAPIEIEIADSNAAGDEDWLLIASHG